MPLQVSYMGTKRALASRVSAVIAKAPPGPLLDLFSGICSIASTVAQTRNVWCNDVQHFASTVADSFFTSPILPCNYDQAAELALPPYSLNFDVLTDRFSQALQEEAIALSSLDLSLLQSLEFTTPNISRCSKLKRERELLSENTSTFPYRLFTITFSSGYLGLKQCIQLDSLRYAFDFLLTTSQLDKNQHKWMSLALCQAMSKVSTTTGHFAQFMRVKPNTKKRFISQRRRCVWTEWLKAMHDMSPIGTSSWRSKNRVFCQDANSLLLNLLDASDHPAVIYADPPYTADQYSRYYHLYETLLLYDYPTAEGVGRYRSDRFCSPFSLKTQVQQAMTSLISCSATLGSTLVLSYPERAVLPNSKEFISSLLTYHFGRDWSIQTIDHYHSSLGASKGREKYNATEMIFSAGQRS